ncbi:DUF3010 family protein [Parendozoicomonas haliclonae]|uniref:DUF3010 domain-containing protein n=1 Tax=Parendozoicomonas haliclonae TaxID=1960125 RepID=A0A1X7APW6_9GAMM|nr:DUF3010 family protein [Parendozoicomonas haliclonae]SMA49399.1 hypothetical protein EHSB41UT_03236 [Parendozoicomonas haliclonae]
MSELSASKPSIKLCSVEIQGSEALFCLMSMDSGLMTTHDCRAARLALQGGDTEKMRHFQSTFKKLMEDYKVTHVVIRERPKKGKFAGGADGFKIETAIQLIDNLKVELIAPQAIKEQLKHTPPPVSAVEAGLKKFQDAAFQTGFAWLNMRR